MDEIGTKLIYDISEFVPEIQKQLELMEEVEKQSVSLQKTVNESTKKQAKSIEAVVDAEKKAINSAKDVVKANEDVSKSYKGLGGFIKLVREEWNKNQLTQERVIDRKKAAIRLRDREISQIKDEIKELSIFGKSFNDINGMYKRATKIIGLNIKILGRFKLALIATGIGAFLVALGSVAAYLTKTQEGMDKVTKVTAQLGAAIKVVVDRFANLGKNLLNGGIFKKVGNNIKNFLLNPIDSLANGLKNVRDGVKDVVEEISDEVKKTGELQDAKVKLRDIERSIKVETAEQRKEIKRLNLIAEDTTKTHQERIKAAKQAGAIERDLVQKQIAAQNERIRILKETMSLSTDMAAQEDEIAEAIATRSDLETASLEMQTTLNNKLNTIEQERLNKIRAIQNAYTQGFENLLSTLSELDVEQASSSEKLILRRQGVIDQLNEEKEALLSLAEALGKSTDEIESGYEKIIQSVNEGFGDERRLDEIELLPSIKFKNPKIKIEGTAETDNESDLFEAFQGIKGNILSALDLSPDEAQMLIEGISDGINQVAQLYSASVDRRLAENERLVDSLQKNREELQRDLERQQDLAEQGADNDVDLVKKRIKETQRLENEAQKESERLKKRQAQIQLAADVAKAAQSLLTGGASMIEAHAGIPFVGLALGLGFVASMFAAFANFKSQTKNLVRLSKGAKRVADYLGFVDKGGQSDVVGRGEGYAIHDPSGMDTGVRMSGSEMLIPQAAATKHEKQLLSLGKNPDDFSIVRNHRDMMRRIPSVSLINENKKNADLIGAKIQEMKQDVVKAIKDKPVAYVINKDSKEVVFMSEGKKETHVLSQ